MQEMMLMDKMCIKLEQKNVPYKPQVYQRGRGQNQRQFSRGNNWRGYRSFSRNHNEGNRGYGRGKVIFGDVIFEEVIFEVDIIIERIEVGKIGEHGDNLGLEKEKEEVGHYLVLDRDQEPVQIETGLGVLNAGTMTTL